MKIHFRLETDCIDYKLIGEYFHNHYASINWELPFLPRIGENLWFSCMTDDLEYFKGLDNAKELNEELLDLYWEVTDIQYDKDFIHDGKRNIRPNFGETVIYIYVKGS